MGWGKYPTLFYYKKNKKRTVKNMIVDLSSKLNFEPKQIKFVEKVYTVKTDHKTGLLLQELYKSEKADDAEAILKLALGDKQYKELMKELEEAGEKNGAENYDENMRVILFSIMSVLYNKPYEYFEKAVENEEKKQTATMI